MPRYAIKLWEDEPVTILGRITALNGSGAATGVAGEGKWAKQADLVSINRKVYDVDGVGLIDSTDLTLSSVILDTPATGNEVWTEDEVGYNFIDDVAASYFTEEEHRYEVEYLATFVGGKVAHAIYAGQTERVRGS